MLVAIRDVSACGCKHTEALPAHAARAPSHIQVRAADLLPGFLSTPALTYIRAHPQESLYVHQFHSRKLPLGVPPLWRRLAFAMTTLGKHEGGPVIGCAMLAHLDLHERCNSLSGVQGLKLQFRTCRLQAAAALHPGWAGESLARSHHHQRAPHAQPEQPPNSARDPLQVRANRLSQPAPPQTLLRGTIVIDSSTFSRPISYALPTLCPLHQ